LADKRLMPTATVDPEQKLAAVKSRHSNVGEDVLSGEHLRLTYQAAVCLGSILFFGRE